MASYSDNFNRPDSSTVTGWTEMDDDWSISSNQLAPGTSTTARILYSSPLSTQDHYAEIVLSNATATSMGIFARADVGANNFYLWRNNGSTWDLFYNVGGSFTIIGTYVAAASNGDVARVECVGSAIKAYVNGVERVSVVDTQVTGGLYVGVRSEASSTTRYDNFAAADIGSAPSGDTGAFFEFLE
jgi:hypothetical protein